MPTALQPRSSNDLARYGLSAAFLLAGLVTGSMITIVVSAVIMLASGRDAAIPATAVALGNAILTLVSNSPGGWLWAQFALVSAPITVPTAIGLMLLARTLWRRKARHPRPIHRVIGGTLLVALAGFGATATHGFGNDFNYANGSDQMPNAFHAKGGQITARVGTDEGYQGVVTYGIMTAIGESPSDVHVAGPSGPVHYVVGRFKPNADGLTGYFLGVPDATYVVASDAVLAVLPITFDERDWVGAAWWTSGPIAALGIWWILSARWLSVAGRRHPHANPDVSVGV